MVDSNVCLGKAGGGYYAVVELGRRGRWRESFVPFYQVSATRLRAAAIGRIEIMIFGFNACNEPPEAYLDYAIEHDLRHIEIDLIKNHSSVESFDEERVSRLSESARELGINLSLHVPYSLDLSSRVPFARMRTTAYLKKCVVLARRLGADHLTVHVGRVTGFPLWPWLRQQALEAVVRTLNRVEPVCRERGVTLALENACRVPADTDVYCLGDCVEDFQYIFERQPSSQIRLCLDVGHANTNVGPLAFIESLGSRIATVHCHDNLGDRDQHLGIGEGTVPWRETCEAFSRIEFRGPYVTECFRQPSHEAAGILRQYFSDGGPEAV